MAGALTSLGDTRQHRCRGNGLDHLATIADAVLRDKGLAR